MAQDVLIAYMNETGESRHYLPIIDMLVSRGHAAAAVRIADDLRTFAGVCYQEALDIAWNAADPESEYRLSFVIFTNAGLRRGNFRYFDARSRNLMYGAIDIPKTEESVYRVTPLANPKVFTLALSLVAERFEPQCHDFHLVTKSHGNRNIALTSLLSSKLGLNQKHLERQISPLEQHSKSHYQSQSLGVGNSAGIREGLGHVGLGFVGLGDFVLPEGEDGVGTTKEQYLDLLGQEYAGAPLRLRTVVLESCQSHLADDLCSKIPKNVERVFTSNSESLRYQTINYERLLRSEFSLHDSFDAVLDGVFVKQRRL